MACKDHVVSVPCERLLIRNKHNRKSRGRDFMTQLPDTSNINSAQARPCNEM